VAAAVVTSGAKVPARARRQDRTWAAATMIRDTTRKALAARAHDLTKKYRFDLFPHGCGFCIGNDLDANQK
jgi:hypothetical protein